MIVVHAHFEDHSAFYEIGRDALGRVLRGGAGGIEKRFLAEARCCRVHSDEEVDVSLVLARDDVEESVREALEQLEEL